MTTWGAMSGSVGGPSPSVVGTIHPIERAEIEWLFDMADYGIQTNSGTLADLQSSLERLNNIKTLLGVS